MLFSEYVWSPRIYVCIVYICLVVSCWSLYLKKSHKAKEINEGMKDVKRRGQKNIQDKAA